jgi:hypothetical protein
MESSLAYDKVLGDLSCFREAFKQFVSAARAEEDGLSTIYTAQSVYMALLAADSDCKARFCFEFERRWLKKKRRFISFNNDTVEAHFKYRRPESVLVLLPFCLQHQSCPHRIVWNVGNCARCGKCPVADVLMASDSYGVAVRVVVRSTFAPRILRELKPELTIAVACEDKLFQGILQVWPYRCFGIVGTRPEGYCVNTRLQMSDLREAMRYFLAR